MSTPFTPHRLPDRPAAASFAVNWDYRCPFARNAHEHVVEALEAGAPWEVTFRAFSLDQAHVEEGSEPVWDHPDRFPGLLANEAGIVVRDTDPKKFLEVHRALFDARHEKAVDLRERDALEEVLDGAGVDGAGVLAEIDAGWPLEVLRSEHTEDVERFDAFGVPTFMIGDRAVFVRLMHRSGGDPALATSTIERVVDLVSGWPELNEFKATTIPR